MNKHFLLLTIGCMLVLAACKPKVEETVEVPAVDSLTEAAPVVIEMDTTAITNKFVERHAKVKSANTNKPRKVEDKNVVYDSDPYFTEARHDDMEPVAADGTAAPKLTDDEGYYFLAPYWAKYPGGEVSLDKYLEDNLKYPKQALSANVQGTVYTVLYVDEAGAIVDARFPGKRLGYGLEEEVARVLKTMPKWEPGSYNDAKVKSKFVLPVKFEIKY